MNVQVVLNSTDITTSTISYTRNHDLCSGVATVSIVCLIDIANYASPWDTVLIYEGGIKKGIFYINSVHTDITAGTCTINCQDGSLKLQSYFVDETFTDVEGTYPKYWIEYLASLAKVSVTFSSTGDGTPIQSNGGFGMESVYELLQPLLQQSGWIMSFNSNGILVVGKLDKGYGSAPGIDDTVITQIDTQLNDAMLRNRVVVWGNSNALGEWVFADASTRTPWAYDSNDIRTVVIANSNINTSSYANDVANIVLQEFARLEFVKVISVAGYISATVGNVISVNSQAFTGVGIITGLQSTLSENGGLITTLTLDERCPRLFAFGDSLSGDVYVGTTGAGVWTKAFGSPTWVEFNTGLTGVASSMYITDLYINRGVFACTTASGELFYKSPSSNWLPAVISGFDEITTGDFYDPSSLFARGVTINSNTNEIACGFNSYVLTDPEFILPGATPRSWIGLFDPYNGTQISGIQLHDGSYDYEYTLVDLDTNDKQYVASISQAGFPTYSGYFGTYADLGYGGNESPEYTLSTASPIALDTSVYLSHAHVTLPDTVYIDGQNVFALYSNATLVKMSVQDGTVDAQTLSGIVSGGSLYALSRKSDDVLYICVVKTTLLSGVYYFIYYYVYEYDHVAKTVLSSTYTFGTSEIRNTYYLNVVGHHFVHAIASNLGEDRLIIVNIENVYDNDFETLNYSTSYTSGIGTGIGVGGNCAARCIAELLDNGEIRLHALYADLENTVVSYHSVDVVDPGQPGLYTGASGSPLYTRWWNDNCVTGNKYTSSILGTSFPLAHVRVNPSTTRFRNWCINYTVTSAGISASVKWAVWNSDRTAEMDLLRYNSTLPVAKLQTTLGYYIVWNDASEFYISDVHFDDYNRLYYDYSNYVADSGNDMLSISHDGVLHQNTITVVDMDGTLIRQIYLPGTIYAAVPAHFLGSYILFTYSNSIVLYVPYEVDLVSNTNNIIISVEEGVTFVTETPSYYFVESSKESPVIGYHPGSGVVYPAYVMNVTGSGIWDIWEQRPLYTTPDYRVVDIISMSGFVPEGSGIAGRYASYVTFSGLVAAFGTTTEEYVPMTIKTFPSGILLTNLETTNLNNPFFFVSASADPIDSFYERAVAMLPADYSTLSGIDFVDYPLIPASGYHITVIRVDDLF